MAINTVGMGHYLNHEYGTFLQQLARDHKGRFIGLGLETPSRPTPVPGPPPAENEGIGRGELSTARDRIAGVPELTRCTVVYINKESRRLQSVVRDEAAHALTAHDRLKALVWMVGDRFDESQDAVVTTSCKWADDGNSLTREFTMNGHGRAILSGTQRIGWDPIGASPRPGSSTPKGASESATGLATGTNGHQGRGRPARRPTHLGQEPTEAARQGPRELGISRPVPRRRRVDEHR